MNKERRQYLALGGLSLLGAGCATAASRIDGVGPNRGVLEQGARGKQTCLNTEVLSSDIETRLSSPEDFNDVGTCNLIEDSFEGPYFTCSPSTGRDIAQQQAGQSLAIAMRLVDNNCNPISNGVVDMWSCNADGYYAGYSNDPDKRPPMLKAMLFGHLKPDTEDRFCRGALRTDADGIAEFNSVYPGYYYGQPIHVHFKAHVNGKNLLTSQANFSEEWNERIMTTAPYNKTRPVKRNTGQTRFPNMRVMERGDKLLAVLDLVVPG